MVVERVRWAWHGSGFTRSFDHQAVWLTVGLLEDGGREPVRISCRSVGNILERVAARLVKLRLVFANLRRMRLGLVAEFKTAG